MAFRSFWGLWLALCCVFGVFYVVRTAHRDKFRKCGETRFCRFHRDLSSQFVITKTLPSKHGFSGILQWPEDPVNGALVLSITRVVNNIVRFHLSEEDSWHQRFEVDTLPQRARVALHVVKEENDSLCVLQWQDLSVEVQFSPFLVRVKYEDEESVVLNHEAMLGFETYRKRQEDDPEEWWEEKHSKHTYYHDEGPASVGLDFTFHSSHLFGIPEHASPFVLKNTRHSYTEPYRLWNLDVFEYELDIPDSLYGAIPFVFSHSPKRSAGVLWLNAAETYVDITDSREKRGKVAHFMSETGVLEAFVIVGNHHEILTQYVQLTGFPQLPPLFSLGHHQCRWNYKDEADVKSVNDKLIQWDTPTDVIWLDIEHTDGKRYFTWDKFHFPNPQDMVSYLTRYGRKMVNIVDPHIKEDNQYYVFEGISEQGLWIKTRDGDDFKGWCWPGDSRYPDCVHPDMKRFWAKQFLLDAYQGSTLQTYIWNDMNEPSVFNGPEETMHKANVHFGGWRHEDLHNLYGYYVQEATYEGLLLRSQHKLRPFVLSRSFFAGTQKYGAIWTGDNTATWEHLRISVPMLLSLGIAGLPFVGADVGGFFQNPDGELMARWYELGCYYPFFRNHAHIDTKRRELWEFDESYALRMRAAIVRRYQLLPYLYTLFHESSVSGAPVMRPLWWEFPEQTSLFDRDDAFMFGNALFVQGIYEADATARVKFPGTESTLWYDGIGVIYRGESEKELVYEKGVPVFQRGGTMIAERRRLRRSSALMARDPLTLVFALNEEKESAGLLYADDGESFQYATHDEYTLVRFSVKECQIRSEVLHSADLGFSDIAIERVVVLGSDVDAKSATLRDTDTRLSVRSLEAGTGIELKTARHLTIGKAFEIKIDQC